MLFRNEIIESLEEEEVQELGRMVRTAFRVRGDMSGLLELPSSSKRWFEPVCHEVAHAFAEVFGGTAVDGEYLLLKEVQILPETKEAVFSTYHHSWIEFSTSPANRFILDVFPEEGCSVFPVLLRAPNPAYWIPTDAHAVGRLSVLKRTLFKIKVRSVVKAMRELAAEPGFPFGGG